MQRNALVRKLKGIKRARSASHDPEVAPPSDPDQSSLPSGNPAPPIREVEPRSEEEAEDIKD